MPTLNLLKSVRCRNLLKHAKDEKSSGVAGELFQLWTTRFVNYFVIHLLFAFYVTRRPCTLPQLYISIYFCSYS